MTTRKSLTALKPAALVLAGVLAGAFFSETFRPTAALAQPDNKTVPPEKLLNSADQFRYMVNGIKETNERLSRIETMLSTGVKVKVTEMPAQPKDK